MALNDGGCAFPTVIARPQDFPECSELPMGMSLRDYFAAKAMQGIMPTAQAKDEETAKNVLAPMVARAAYAMADAMLAERNKK